MPMSTDDPSDSFPYAPKRSVASLSECTFYHTMEIRGHGVVSGEWDLRGREDKYLGGFDFNGKRVLEVGTASGFLCFHMESRGAHVVGYDLSEDYDWDVVPFSTHDNESFATERRQSIRALNNGWWLAHDARRSGARVAYGSVYAIPEAIGKVDVATFGAMLLHVRDPFLALQNVVKLNPDTIIVTEPLSLKYSLSQIVSGKVQPGPIFLPNRRRDGPRETWWLFTPDLIERMLGVLGFDDSKVHYHLQRYQNRMQPMFTVVANRA